MKKTSKELADFYGIKVGDTVKVKVTSEFGKVNSYTAVLYAGNVKLKCEAGFMFDVWDILDCEYEVIKPKKTYGDLKCKDFYICNECPLNTLNCSSVAANTLYGVLEKTFIETGRGTDNPIYKAFKAELDKEVEE